MEFVQKRKKIICKQKKKKNAPDNLFVYYIRQAVRNKELLLLPQFSFNFISFFFFQTISIFSECLAHCSNWGYLNSFVIFYFLIFISNALSSQIEKENRELERKKKVEVFVSLRFYHIQRHNYFFLDNTATNELVVYWQGDSN